MVVARWCVVVLVVFGACDRSTPTASHQASVRTRAELLDELHVSAAGRAVAEPPREEELAWIVDRSLAVDDRIEQGMRLFDDTKAMMKRFFGDGDDAVHDKEGVAVLRWSAATVAVFAYIIEVVRVEVVPNDPGRVDLARLRLGAIGMLMGGLSILSGQQGDIGGRRILAATWARHIHRYTALWGPNGCPAPAAGIGAVLARETDVAIVFALQVIEQALASCGSLP